MTQRQECFSHGFHCSRSICLLAASPGLEMHCSEQWGKGQRCWGVRAGEGVWVAAACGMHSVWFCSTLLGGQDPTWCRRSHSNSSLFLHLVDLLNVHSCQCFSETASYSAETALCSECISGHRSLLFGARLCTPTWMLYGKDAGGSQP